MTLPRGPLSHEDIVWARMEAGEPLDDPDDFVSRFQDPDFLREEEILHHDDPEWTQND